MRCGARNSTFVPRLPAKPPLTRGARSMQIYYKMYLAQPRMGPPKDAMSAPDRFPFVFSRATDSDSLFAIIGEHGDDLLPGVEEGLVGMRVRALVVFPSTRSLVSSDWRQAQAGGAPGERIRHGGVHAQGCDDNRERSAGRYAPLLHRAGARRAVRARH